MHGHGEAEQAAGVAARFAHEILGVQVKGGTRRHQGDQQRKSGDRPHSDLCGFWSSSPPPPPQKKNQLWSLPESPRLSAGGRTVHRFTAAAPPSGLPVWHTTPPRLTLET